MIYFPISLLLFLVVLLLLPILTLGLTVNVVEVAVAKLGFSPNVSALLLFLVILGSAVNIPLYKSKSSVARTERLSDLRLREFWGIPLRKIQNYTVIALNVGGGLIPVALALYQFTQASAIAIVIVTAIVTAVSFRGAKVVPGVGIAMNPFLAPVTAAISAMLIANTHAAPVAFAGGVLGTLIGADILHLKEIQSMSSGMLSIGGAGVFDGIALCGLFALLLT